MILELGKSRNIDLNPVSGILGSFYQENRAEDIKQLCQLLIKDLHETKFYY